MKVDGPENKAVYSGKEVDNVYLGDAAVSASRSLRPRGGGRGQPDARAAGGSRRSALQWHLLGVSSGQGRRHRRTCSRRWRSRTICWQTRSARSASCSMVSAGPSRSTGKRFDSVMPPMSQLNDDEIANILTYVLNSWGNSGGRVQRAGGDCDPPESTPRPQGAAH